jgi:Pyruvate/2-oxoacid:ferredoxin oxidoreductase delta subunit
MVLRNIVKIDEDKCDGCGLCITACAEGAIELVEGKAKLVSEIYCDGLGACLSHCPQNAITVEQRQAEPFDHEATEKHLAQQKQTISTPTDFVCPGLANKQLREKTLITESSTGGEITSQLTHWPVQLRLLSPKAPFLNKADLLLVADCVPFAMGDFHNKLLKGRTIAVGCPKLDDSELYVQKLTEILNNNNLNSLMVIHMEVPCCSGLTQIAQQAIKNSGVKISLEDITIDLKGNISKTETIENT